MDERTRTYSWEDPLAPLGEMAELTGLEVMRRMIAGELPQPPIAWTLDFRLVEAERGRVVFECEPAEFHYNPIGAVHGGLACTLLDSALGCAGHSTLPPDVGYTSVDLNVRYLRPITHASGLLRATGRVVKGGRRVIFTEGELTDAEGRVVATATSSLLVLGPAG